MTDERSPSSQCALTELVGTVRIALESMDAIDREILVLRHFEQLSPTETALSLGIHEKAAAMRYVRAIRRLRKLLSALPGGSSQFRI